MKSVPPTLASTSISTSTTPSVFKVRKESRRKKRRIDLKTTGRGFNRNVKHEKT